MTIQKKHLVIIAGEASGDQHGAALIQALAQENIPLTITGLGGQHMEKAGATLLYPLARLGITGLSGIVRHFLTIRRVFYSILEHIQKTQPDLIILIDYPGFNLRLLKQIKQKTQARVLYYISPQIWAWKPKRIQTIKQYVDHIAVIFPFEKMLYQAAGVPVSFVGHPLIQTLAHLKQHPVTRASFNLPEHQTLIALLPGSRTSEIEYHLPILRKTAQLLSQKNANLHFVIPIANTLSPQFIRSFWSDSIPNCSFIEGHALKIASISDFILVASGTASLECALLQKPMAIIYRASRLTAVIASQCLRVRYLGLCNLLSQRMIVPEFLQYDCHPEHLAAFTLELLSDLKQQEKMKQSLHQLQYTLSSEQADETLAELIIRLI